MVGNALLDSIVLWPTSSGPVEDPRGTARACAGGMEEYEGAFYLSVCLPEPSGSRSKKGASEVRGASKEVE